MLEERRRNMLPVYITVMAVNFSSTKSFMELHEDVMIEIFQHLDIKSLVSVALTCKKLKVVAYTP